MESHFSLSHLFFADDILLYAHYNDTTVQSIISILSYFSNISGQKVNSSKSKLFFEWKEQERIIFLENALLREDFGPSSELLYKLIYPYFMTHPVYMIGFIITVLIKDISTLLFLAIWHLWLCRNSRFFSPSRNLNHFLSPQTVLFFATEFVSLGPFIQKPLSIKKSPLFISWYPPISPYIKLNTDGSALPNPGVGGLGGVFRNSEGQWLLGYCKHIPYATSLVAELLAIKEGLKIAITQNYSHLLTESDSLVALTLLKENNNAKLKNLVNDCRFLIWRMVSVKLQHTFREANQMADHLASSGRSLNQSHLSMVQ